MTKWILDFAPASGTYHLETVYTVKAVLAGPSIKGSGHPERTKSTNFLTIVFLFYSSSEAWKSVNAPQSNKKNEKQKEGPYVNIII